jgi:hypothetical protein
VNARKTPEYSRTARIVTGYKVIATAKTGVRGNLQIPWGLVERLRQNSLSWGADFSPKTATG